MTTKLQVISKSQSSPIHINPQPNETIRIQVEENIHAKVLWKLQRDVDIEINLAKHASIENYMVTTEDAKLNIHLVQQDSSSVKTFYCITKGNVEAYYLVDLEGQHAEHVLNCGTLSQQNEKVCVKSQFNHCEPNSRSQQVIKNIAKDSAHVEFEGLIKISPDATDTEAHLQNKILLTNEAKGFSRPQLIIDHDTVKCSHGSTIGEIDKQALFYMQSRGINRQLAHEILLKGFLTEVLQDSSLDTWKEDTENLIQEALIIENE